MDYELQKFIYYANITADTNNCWLWKGPAQHGYGLFYLNSKRYSAHRWIYEHVVEEIPPGFVLDHLCENKLCINPRHLEVVTNAENISRHAKKQTTCRKGHEWTPENTYTRPGGTRLCRECVRAVGRRRFSRSR